MANTNRKICFVVSAPETANSFLLPHLAVLSESYSITLIANLGQVPESPQFGETTVTLRHVPINRKVSLVSDCKALLALMRVFREEGYCCVHSVTPKAGLLAMLAARLMGVPHRFHTFTGQVWATRKGIVRTILKALDRVIARCTTFALVDSGSQRAFLVAEGVLSEDESTVLANGSIVGVNVERFHPDPVVRHATREALGLDQDAFVFLFIGRINKDKGVSELLDAFNMLAYRRHRAYVWVVGPEEDATLAEKQEVIAELGMHFIRSNYTTAVDKCMAAADVICLPSHREGFGSVLIEAAATGVPSIASNIYGISDAVEDGVTGLLHPKSNPREIARLMESFLEDRDMGPKMGEMARLRAVERFSQDLVVGALREFYFARVGCASVTS